MFVLAAAFVLLLVNGALAAMLVPLILELRRLIAECESAIAAEHAETARPADLVPAAVA
jgi:hypothetical protein